MIWKAIFYTSLLVAFLIFMILYDKGFSFKNSLIISMFAPLVGGLFILAGTFLAVFLTAMILFGSIFYMLNRKKIMKFGGKNFKFKVYRV